MATLAPPLGGLTFPRLGLPAIPVTAALPWLEPLVVVALAPVAWFPSGWLPILLLTVPALLITRWRLSGRPFPATPTLIPLAALVPCLALTALVVVDPSATAPRYWVLALGIALIATLPAGVGSPAELRRAVGGLVALAPLLVVPAVLTTEWPVGKIFTLDLYRTIPFFGAGLTEGGRHGGLHPNLTAATIVTLAPLILAWTLAGGRQEASWRWRVVLGGSLLTVMLFALVLSQSRGGALGLLMGGAILTCTIVAIIRPPVRALRAGTVAGACAFGLLGVATLPSAIGWLDSYRTGLGTFADRTTLWETSLAILRDLPVTGAGPGQFQWLLDHVYPALWIRPGEHLAHAHNGLLQLALDLGIPGALAFCVVLASATAPAIRLICDQEATPGDRLLAGGVVAGLAAYLGFSAVDAVSVTGRGALPLYILTGLAAATWRLGPAWQLRLPRPEPRAVAGLSAAFVVVAALGLIASRDALATIQAVRAAPAYPALGISLAPHRLEQRLGGEPPTAVAALARGDSRRALELASRRPWGTETSARLVLGRARALNGDLPGALDAWSPLANRPIRSIMVANALFAEGRRYEQPTAIRRAIELMSPLLRAELPPRQSAALGLQLAWMYGTLGDLAGRIDVLDTALTVAPGHGEVAAALRASIDLALAQEVQRVPLTAPEPVPAAASVPPDSPAALDNGGSVQQLHRS